MNKQNGSNWNGFVKGGKCRTPGCNCTANADTGYCFTCEITWKQWANELAGWIALRDAAEEIRARR